jgi:iron complex outermembrane receptor protein
MVLLLAVLPPVSIALAADKSQESAIGPASNKVTNLPAIDVTARKWNEPLQSVPGSVSVQTADAIEKAGVRDLRDAARYVPNLTLGDFSVRRLTFPFIRGIGSGRNTAAITTYIDGVPQLSYATANQQLLDIDRIEFLRGSQGSLYGRNTLGGAISILPRLPTPDTAASVTLSAGDYGYLDARITGQGPISDGGAAWSLSSGYSMRDGYTKNDLTGNTLDDRSAFFGRVQALWPCNDDWSVRFSVSGETDRDGDYTLSDLASLRARPYHVTHDYEGYSDRDILQPALTVTYSGESMNMVSVTAYQWWQSHDRTDLDTTPADLMIRDAEERQGAWIEEIRFTSPDNAPVRLGDHVDMRWLLGAFGFSSSYRQRAFTDYRPGIMQVPAFGIPVPYEQHDDADLDDSGASLFGQATFTLNKLVELGLGLRHDYEHRSAELDSYSNPMLMPPSAADTSRDFNETSPRGTLAFHIYTDMLLYAEASKGYKAGGFNAQAPEGKTAFDDETSWTYEAGLKTAWLRNRIIANVALFETDWDDLQMDVPASTPGLFYIDNAGKATTRGAELELTVRPLAGLDLFGSIGVLSSEFRSGSTSAGIDVSGNELPFAPRTTWRAGAEYSHTLGTHLRGSVRVEGVGTSSYYYDAFNSISQDTYTLVNTRIGLGSGTWRLEAWVNNVFDEEYVPIAFPYQLASSGYVGEIGAPRTTGVSISKTF